MISDLWTGISYAELVRNAALHIGAADITAIDDFAELEHRVTVGDRQCELHVLLDQQNRHLRLVALGAQNAGQPFDDRRLDRKSVV